MAEQIQAKTQVEEQTQVDEKEKQEQLTWLDKAKSAFNKAQLSRYLGLLFVVSFTVIVSLWQVGWDPARIGWQKFVANTALLLALGVYGIFFGEQEGGSLFKKLITGLYQTVRDEFLKLVNKIKEKAYIDSLPDYIVWRYQKDYENTCKMKMLSVRVFDPSVCDLTDEQIEQLRREPLQINAEKHYCKLSQEQYNVVRAIKDGKIFVDYIDDYTFYLVEDASDGKQVVTRVKETDSRKERIKLRQRLSRMILIVLFALILAGFFYELPQETIMGGAGGQAIELTAEQLKAIKEAKLQAFKDLFSRISCLVVSIASGFNTARLLNLEDVFVLKYKIGFNNLFIGCMENKTFVPMDIEEKAKKEYEKFQKEKEEALKNVVDPEPVLLLDSKENKD